MQFPAMERNWYTNIAKGLDLALLAYLVTGFFVTVFYYPYFWINLGMTVSLNNVVKIEAKDLTDYGDDQNSLA